MTRLCDVMEPEIAINGAGVIEANGFYSRVQTNYLSDGGLAVYDKGSEKDWNLKWLIAYYPASSRFGPAWYIQQGLCSAYKSKLSKDPEQYPDLLAAKVPTSGWVVYQGAFEFGAVKPLPFVLKTSDLKASMSLLQHLLDGKCVASLNRDGAQNIIQLADEARQLKVPGAIVTEPLWDGAKASKAFNEVRGPRGKCRPAYASVVEIMEKVMEGDRKKGLRRIDDFPVVSLKDFRGDNRLYHIPRMLTKAETDMLVKGIAQRAKAAREFILDMNRSRSVEKMACIQNKALPEDVFRRIAARAAHVSTSDLVDKSKASSLYWNLWYGPDIIRGPDENGSSQFYVVEDNFGYVGGFGDLIESRKVLLKTFPELEPAIGDDHTAAFYDEMGRHYYSQVAPGEKVVVLYYKRRSTGAASVCADNEDKRMAEILKKRGIAAVALPGDSGPEQNQARLEVRNKKVYLVTPQPNPRTPVKGQQTQNRVTPVKERPIMTPARCSPARSPLTPRKQVATGDRSEEPPKKRLRADDMLEEPVGLVILLSEPSDVQPGHESTKLSFAIANAKHHIEVHEEDVRDAKLYAKGSEKSVMKINTKLDVTDKEGRKSSLQMRGGKLVWIVHDKDGKEFDRIKGPLAWDVLKYQLSGQRSSEEVFPEKPVLYKCVFDTETAKNIEKAMSLDDLPMDAARAQVWVDELRAAVENVGQLVGGRANHKAPEELFRLLRLHNKKDFERLFKGKRGVPGLLDAYYSGGVKIANGPGFVLLDDKELCAHSDKLIRYYLKEEPILKTIPTRSFATEPELLQSVFDDPRTQENVVVKRVDGRGGDAVWVGAKLSRTDFLAARPLAEAEPDAFLVQKYTTLSQVDGHLVDLRGPAFISSSGELSAGMGVAVSPVLWGRGVPEKGGNGKVNISDAGFQFTVATSADA
eukprot:CAMPEP_0169100874 /NCGR_PEP_ID=MMETSP1015-20121227/21324_1 /TAXON_ID=342587 /ORGANISM="Karlodinium micrum, Strain CCMP2283" /LENGTH=919 /DNA_ID=CAMNT_0009161853 /DNA_START=41 /DNA_END=2800 /DNA_ORIENTATION=+